MKVACFVKTKNTLNRAKLSKLAAIKIPCVQSTNTQPSKPGLEDHGLEIIFLRKSENELFKNEALSVLENVFQFSHIQVVLYRNVRFASKVTSI